MALAENAKKTLTRKKRLVRKLMQTALSKPGDRKGIIAGGMVCWLKDSSTGFVPDDFQEQVYRNHRNLRLELGVLRDRSVQLTPEERKPVSGLKISIQRTRTGIATPSVMQYSSVIEPSSPPVFLYIFSSCHFHAWHRNRCDDIENC